MLAVIVLTSFPKLFSGAFILIIVEDRGCMIRDSDSLIDLTPRLLLTIEITNSVTETHCDKAVTTLIFVCFWVLTLSKTTNFRLFQK